MRQSTKVWGTCRTRVMATVAAVAMACMLWSWCYAAGAQPELRGSGSSNIYALTKGAPVPDNPNAIPGRVLVKFKTGNQGAALERASKAGAVGVLKERNLRGTAWHLLTVKAPKGIKAAVETLRIDPDVLYAEPDYRVRACGAGGQSIPNDPRFNELWGMHNTGQTGGTADADIDAPEAWQSTTSSSVLVAVIDTGIDRNHADLAANMWVNLAELNGTPKVDDDGNGFVDDVYGWNFAYNNNNPMDDFGHGTHCSGTIGAVGNNAIGVAGVCWNVKIMAVKFLDSEGSGSTSGAVEATNYAVMMGAKVLSNSWAGGGYSQALKDAIDAANAAGVLFVAAAGNNGTNNDTLPSYPASYDCPNIIAVAATDNNDALASFSCYGAATVDLAGPGVSILSTTPGNTYSVFSGTSMATPHVSGVCALVWGAAPGMPQSTVKALILAGVDPKPSLAGKCLSGGRVNAANSLSLVGGRQLRINAPNGGENYETGCTVDIHWTAIGTGWQPGIDTLALAYSPDNGSTWIPVSGSVPFDSGSFAWSTVGLATGGQYLVRATFNGDATIHDSSNGPFAITGPLDHFDFLVASPQIDGRPVTGTCTITAKDSSGRTIGTFGDFNTAGRFPVAITAADVVIGGLGGPGNQLSAGNFTAGTANLTALGMTVDAAAPPITRAFVATSANGKTGTYASVTILEAHDYFTELFDTSFFDLDNSSVMFIPNGSASYYAAFARRSIASLPVDPAGGTVVSLGDDNYAQVNLTGGAQAPLYGVSRSTFYVGSNGYITFGAGDSTYIESLAAHFARPRISALFDDLDPSAGGQVSYKQLADQVAVTFLNVPQHGAGDSNTFQIEMFYDGRIVLSYLGIDALNVLAGISAGNGVQPDFLESDLSAYPPFGGNASPLAQSSSASLPWNTTCAITLQASDDGKPNPPGVLDCIVYSLPAHGSLDDPAPAGGAIVTTPYTLLDHGNQVRYTPTAAYSGADGFQFEAYDSALFSNVAQVGITVVGPPPAPHAPTPNDGAVDVPLDTNLHWSGGPTTYLEDFSDGQAQDWQEDVDADWNVVNEKYVANAPSAGMPISMVATYSGQEWSDCYCEVWLRRSQKAGTYAQYMLVRATADFESDPSPTGSGYGFGIDQGHYYIYKQVNGASTHMVGWTYSPYINPSETGNTLGVNLVGATLQLFINSNLVWTGSDISLTSGRIGFLGYTAPGSVTTHYFDNVAVNDSLPLGANISAEQVWYNSHPIGGGTVQSSPKGAMPVAYPGDGNRSNATTAPVSQRAGAAVQQNATTYDVYFGVTDPPQVLIATNLGQPTCDPTPALGQLLAQGTTYYWKVVERNAAGETPGPVWRFTTCGPPPPPFGATPADGATGVPVDTNLRWNSGTTGYLEDFSDGQAQDWHEDVDADWNVVKEEYVANEPSAAQEISMVATYSGQEWSDCYYEVCLRCSEKGDFAYAQYVLVRATADFESDPSASTGSGYAFGIDEGMYYIYKQVNGAFAGIVSWTASPYINPMETGNRLGVNLAGTTLQFFANGHLIWTGSDSSLTSGRIGLLGYTAPDAVTTHYFDDVAVNGSLSLGASISAEQAWYNSHPIGGGTPQNSPKGAIPVAYPGDGNRSNATTAPASQRAGTAVQQNGITYDVYVDVTNPPQVLIATNLGQPICCPTSAPGPQLDFGVTYYWLVVAKNTAGQTPGPVWHFTTARAPLDHFAWSDIASPQGTAHPFGTTITARDMNGNTVVDFTGTVGLSGRCPITLLQADFENDTNGFVIDNSYGAGGGLWHRSTGRGGDAGHSSSHSFYYGQGEGPNGGGNFDAGHTQGAVVSPPISLAGIVGPIFLSFNYLLQTEHSGAYDQARVEVSSNGGPYELVASNDGLGGVALQDPTGGLWVSASVDLSSYAGSQIQIRFQFNTVDGEYNAFEGWYLDDVSVQGCLPVPVSPTVSGNFINGTWTGSVAVLKAAQPVYLCADDGNGSVGQSNVFEVIDQFCTLSVQSTPITGVAITGTRAGTTNYEACLAPGESVTLEAPAHPAGGYAFDHWTLNGADKTIGQSLLTFNINSNSTAMAVYRSPSTVTTVLSAAAIALGQHVTDTATVAGPAGALLVPSGSVVFEMSDDGALTWTTYDAGELLNNGTAVSTAYTPFHPGNYLFRAVYAGDANYEGSQSGDQDEPLDVAQADSTTTTLLSADHITLGETATDTATVEGLGAPAGGGQDFPVPMGTVDFQVSDDGGATWTTFDAGELLNNGTAVSTAYTPLHAGIYWFRAIYSGNSHYNGSVSGEQDEPLVVDRAASTTTTLLAHSQITLGQSVTDTASVTGLGSSFPVPTGSINFQVSYNSGAFTTYDTKTLSNGSATSAAYTPLAAGSYRFRAVYAGDSNYNGSQNNDEDEPLTVGAANSTTSTQLSSSLITLGQGVTDTATVTGLGGSFPIPSGTVTFQVSFNGGSFTTYDTKTLSSGSATSAAYTPLAAGGYRFRALYAGDTNYTGSQSGDDDEPLTVSAASSATATQLSSASVTLSQSVTDTATVAGLGGSYPVPTGSVTFQVSFSGGAFTTYDTKTLSSGSATSASYTPASTGQYLFRALCSGDSNYNSSQSGDQDEPLQVDAPPTFKLTVQASPTLALNITGYPAGMTNYDAQCACNSSVSLTAPATKTVSGKVWYFVRWTRNGTNQTLGARTLSFTIAGPTTVVAKYKRVNRLYIYGPSSLYERTTALYTCRATFTDGSSAWVTSSATWSDNTPYLKFVSAGKLQAYSVPHTMTRTIYASYGGVKVSKNVTIRKR